MADFQLQPCLEEGPAIKINFKKKMKCVICKSPNIQGKTVEEEFRIGSDMVLIPVETLVYVDCGEVKIDAHTI